MAGSVLGSPRELKKIVMPGLFPNIFKLVLVCWVGCQQIIKVPRIHVCVLSQVSLSATLWTGARQAPLSMEFSRQEYRSGVPFPPGESSSREERNRPSWLHLEKEENSISHFQ